jgi:hypothetical protein
VRWQLDEVGGRVCLLVLLLVAALPASAQAGGPHALKVTVDPPSRPQDPGSDTYVIGTRNPTFHIQADLSGAPPDYRVRCQVDDPPDGPCGTQDSQCPVTQCWTFTASHDSDGDGHTLTVSIASPDGSDDYDSGGVFYSIDTTPPDTQLDSDPASYPIEFPDARHVQFTFGAPDPDTLDATFQCAITAPGVTAPVSWSKCSSGQRQPQKLALTGTYRFWVRAIDFLGRPDPTPVSYLFSPTPCHLKLVSHPHRLRAIAQRKLKLRMSCVQPAPFEVALLLNSAQQLKLGLPSPVLGLFDGQTKAPQTSTTFTFRTYRGLPKKLFRQKKLFVALSTSTLGSPPKLTELKLHR